MQRKPLFMIIIPLFFTISCDQESNSDHQQPKLVADSVDIIRQDGLEFKDLNKNGVLDPYEDWRLSPRERSQDLLSKMSPEEKAGMLLIADMRMKNEQFMLEMEVESEPITTEFNEEDVVIDKNQFTGEPLAFPVMQSIGTTKGITEHQTFHMANHEYPG